MSVPLDNFKNKVREAGLSIELAKRWSVVSQWVVRGERNFAVIVTIDGEHGFELFYSSDTIAIDKDVERLVEMCNKR